MTKIIGLTGGIGSGKTTIAKYFQTLGIPVYIADEEAKKISDSPRIVKLIVAVFGNEIVENKKLNREKLAQIVFNDEKKLKQLNEIIHPEVKKHFNNWLTKHSKSKFVIKETAILFESGNYKECNFVITVIAPLEIRIQRVINRDKTTLENVMKRINNQWTDEMKIAKSDYIIENTDLNNAKSQADIIVEKLTIQ